MTDQPSAGTGTVMRADMLREDAEAAGFRNAEVLDDLEHDTLRFYRLTPYRVTVRVTDSVMTAYLSAPRS